MAESHSHSAAVEDYTKAIYKLQTRASEPVSNNALAEELGVTPGSASAMVKKLVVAGLVEHVPYKGVELTPSGLKVALEVIRHHRLLELYLAEHLDVPWDRVHAEADVLEHVLSEELEASIANKLGDPTHDPHGDPIPNAKLVLEESESHSLQSLEPGDSGKLVRVSDSDPAMLRYLSERGISIGDEFEVVEKQPFDGPLSVRFGHQLATLGGGLASAMRVELK